MKIIKNVAAYIGGKGVYRTNIVFGERIASVGDSPSDAEPFDLPENAIVLPGFIDEHIHGAFGADAMDASADALGRIATAVAAEGTVRFLATTMTQSKSAIIAAVKSVAEYNKAQNPSGAAVEGVHLEGPFISPAHVGAQPPEWVRKPDTELFDEINAASGNLVKMVTLAPEQSGAEELITHLKKLGITVSLGHTAASFEQIMRAKECGATCITHLFNAQSGVHHRAIGTVGAALVCDGLYTEIIADCIHVSVPAIKLALKCKPCDRIILITDAMRAKGLPDGESELGGQKVFVKEGQARLSDGVLAGSVLKMNEAIRNMVKRADVPFTAAVDFATINPAKNLGIAGDTGSIEAGKCADLTVIDRDFNVLYTVRGGNVIYKAR